MRARQRMILSPGADVVFERLQQNESGQFEFKEVNDSTTVLPDTSTTDIKALLDAGIDPKRVNTKIIPSSSVVTDLSVPEEISNNSEEKGE